MIEIRIEDVQDRLDKFLKYQDPLRSVKTLIFGWVFFLFMFVVAILIASPDIFTIENIIPLLVIPQYLPALLLCGLLDLLSIQFICDPWINSNHITWMSFRLITGAIFAYILGQFILAENLLKPPKNPLQNNG